MRRPTALVALAVMLLTGCSAPAPPAPTTTAAAVRVDAGVPFADVGGTTLKLDACLPRTSGTHPALVVVHGGAFDAGGRALLRPECEEAATNGFATFVVDYRLSGDGSKSDPVLFPDQLDDVSKAVRWLREARQSARFQFDRNRMILLGESAGAVLASEIAVQIPGSPLPRSTFKGVVLLSGVYDFNADDLSSDLLSIGRTYLGCVPGPTCAPTRPASAVDSVRTGTPPMLLINATDELVPVGQTKEFAARLTAAGIKNTVVLAPGAYHALDIARHSATVRSAILSFCRTWAGS